MLPKPTPVADPEQAWRQREQRLLGLRDWSAVGRIALRTADEAWSISMYWKQRGDAYHIRFSAPLGQGLMEISGGPQGVILRTSKNEVYTAADPETLLFDAVGWRVPLRGLRYWILGRTEVQAPVTALELDPAGRLQHLQQSNWQLEYLRYGQVGTIDLPTKVFLENSRLSARIIVNRWVLES